MCTGQDMFVGHVWYENSGMSDISYVVLSGAFEVRDSGDHNVFRSCIVMATVTV